eukprot:3299786-Amphidinium_carterae.1
MQKDRATTSLRMWKFRRFSKASFQEGTLKDPMQSHGSYSIPQLLTGFRLEDTLLLTRLARA